MRVIWSHIFQIKDKVKYRCAFQLSMVKLFFFSVLQDSVTECLLMLELNSFTLQLITEARDTANQLGNGNSGNRFTVFAFNDSAADAAPNGHIVNASIEGKRLLDGSILLTLAENVSIHIRKGQNTKVRMQWWRCFLASQLFCCFFRRIL